MTVTEMAERVRVDALKVDPVKAVLVAVLLPFLLIGWSVRLVGWVLAFAGTAVRHGYRDAGEWLQEREQRRARST